MIAASALRIRRASQFYLAGIRREHVRGWAIAPPTCHTGSTSTMAGGKSIGAAILRLALSQTEILCNQLPNSSNRENLYRGTLRSGVAASQFSRRTNQSVSAEVLSLLPALHQARPRFPPSWLPLPLWRADRGPTGGLSHH